MFKLILNLIQLIINLEQPHYFVFFPRINFQAQSSLKSKV